MKHLASQCKDGGGARGWGASRPARALCSSQDCGKPLSIEADDNGCFPLDGHVLCRKCHTARA